MSRPSSSAPARRHATALGLVAAVLLMTACRGSDAGTATAPVPSTAQAPATTEAPGAPASVATAPVPPPPMLAALPAEGSAPAGGTTKASTPAGGTARAPAPVGGTAYASPPAGDTAQALATAHARLEDALAKAGACSADNECRSLPVGGKACGGPTGYRAYSAKTADPAMMQALAQQEHDLALQEARESHRVSNCMMLGDPGARCVAAKCETGGPNGPRGPATR